MSSGGVSFAARPHTEMASNAEADPKMAKRHMVPASKSSLQVMRKTKRRRIGSQEAEDGIEPSLQSMPAEMFCKILSFIGPVSGSLLRLTELNHYFHDTMKTIGDAMVTRASAHFRVPFPPKSVVESSTSLFLRHARACSRVLDDLTELRGLLQRPEEYVNIEDVNRAMELGLNLLEVGPTLSVSLERQILSTCGKLGGRAFKYCKSRLLNSLGARVSDDVSPPTLRRRNQELTDNEERLDMSRLIMQIVVCRDWQLSKQYPSRLLHAKIQDQMSRKASSLR